MELIHALLLGVIEGITEFLPISSTGHLILAGELLHIPSTEFQKSFDIIIQLGAILSVIVLYWNTLWDLEVIKKLIVAFIPTGVIGLLFYKSVKLYLLGDQYVVLGSLLFGGVALILFELWHRENDIATESINDVTYRQAALIGVFQALAIIPGLSRSAATIIGGLLLGLRRATIVEFSFLLAVPTMLAASSLDIIKNYQSFTPDQIGILSVGFITSFIVALLSIKFLLSYIRKHNFIPFGIYRILAAVLFWFFILK